MRWDLGDPVGMALFNEIKIKEIKKVAAYDNWGNELFEWILTPSLTEIKMAEENKDDQTREN